MTFYVFALVRRTRYTRYTLRNRRPSKGRYRYLLILSLLSRVDLCLPHIDILGDRARLVRLVILGHLETLDRVGFLGHLQILPRI